MYSAGSAVLEIDRKRLRTSVVVSALIWACALPFLSLLRYEGPIPEPSMNPVYIELEPLPPPETAVAESEPPLEAPPAEETRPEPRPRETEMVEIAEETARAASSAPSPTPEPAVREGPVPREMPEAAAATPSLRPDPSASPVAARRTTASAARGGGEPFAPLSEEAFRAAAPPAPEAGQPPAQTGPQTERTSSRTASTGTTRSDAFDRTLRRTTDRLSSAPAGSAAPSAAAGSGTSSAATAGRADIAGGFDFGDGAKRELLSPRRIRVPDKLLVGLPETVSTVVSFKIEGGGTVYRSSIRFEPPLPEDLAAYLRTAFSAWQFSFADSDGQVVFRYSINVR